MKKFFSKINKNTTADNDSADFSFVHISDFHYKNSYEGMHSEKLSANTGLTLTEQFVLGIREIIKDSGRIDFFILSGDLCQNGTANEYECFKKILDEEMKGIPYYLSLGNHDNDNFWNGFLGKPEKTGSYYYSINHEGLRIISLDSRGGAYESGFLEQEQLSWLKNELSIPAEKGSILLLHHTPHVSGEIEYLIYQTENPSELYEVVENSDIKGIFCGHTHKYFASTLGSIPCYTAESLCFGIDTYEDKMIISNYTGYNYCSVTNGTLNVNQKVIVPDKIQKVTIMYTEF